jgi:hypothetical protein
MNPLELAITLELYVSRTDFYGDFRCDITFCEIQDMYAFMELCAELSDTYIMRTEYANGSGMVEFWVRGE